MATIIRQIIVELSCFVDAVSYRTPQSVTKLVKFHDGYCYPICPRCNTSMDRVYTQFCDRCGQKLDWDNIEDAEILDYSIFR